MRSILLYFFFLLTPSEALAGVYDTTIAPIPLIRPENSPLNDTLKKEITAIMYGDSDSLIHTFKNIPPKNFIWKSYKSYEFHINLPRKPFSSIYEEFKTKIHRNAPFIGYISYVHEINYAHEKYQVDLQEKALSIINKEIASHYGGQRVTCEITAFISKDHFRKYLHIALGEGGERTDYILILNRDKWQCVRYP